jgi:hypothetical protein
MSATSKGAQLDARIPVSMVAECIAGERVAGENQTGERWG